MTGESEGSLVLDARRILGTLSIDDERIVLGVDVVAVSEFARILATPSGEAFASRTFSAGELAYCDGRANRLAARFAAKEAVVKAIGTGFRGIRPSQIEVLHGAEGQPSIQAVGPQEWPESAHLWRWALSLSHDGDAAVAVAIAVRPAGDHAPANHAAGTKGAQHD